MLVGSGWIWLVVLCLLLSNKFLDDLNILKHIETTSVANAANDSKRVSNGIDQGLVTVPFWKQLNITFKCLSGDYIPKSPIIGWCFMRTFTRPCWSTRIHQDICCHWLSHRSAPKDRYAQYGTPAVPEVNPTVGAHPGTWGLGMELMSQWTNASRNQWINESVGQWISEAAKQWLKKSSNQWTKESRNQWVSESMIEWFSE